MLHITLLIFLHEGKEKIFNEYEAKVLPLLPKYNGKLLSRMRPEKDETMAAHLEQPYEIHILSFATKQDFENYKLDEERKSYAYMYNASVKNTVLTETEV